MPVEAVIIDTTIEALGAREPSEGNICVMGHDAGGSASDDIITEITQLSDAQTQFGTGTDITDAIDLILQQRVPKIYAIRSIQTDVVAESITQGSLQVAANFPIAGRPAIDIDSGVITVNFVYGTPVAPAATEANVNPNTGEFWIDGVGSSSVDYSYIDWVTTVGIIAAFIPAMDILVMANAPNEDNGRFYGDLDELINAVDANSWVTAIMSAGDEAAAVIATSFGDTEFSSRNVMVIAHKSTTEDVAAAVAGLMSVTEPWKKMMWKTLRGLTTTYFTVSEVETTLEGATNPVNAVIQKVTIDVSSDGLTTVGGPTYEWIDITRTRYYLESLITIALDDLIRLSEIPYTDQGIASVRSSIERALQKAVDNGALRTPFINTDGDYQRGYQVEVPALADIPAADKTNRLLDDVFVTAWLAGHVQAIQLNLSIQI